MLVSEEHRIDWKLGFRKDNANLEGGLLDRTESVESVLNVGGR